MKNFFKQCIVVLLRWEAQIVLRRYKPHVVAVTGSVGKTATKDAIYSVIAKSAHARKSEKSFNSEIGLPLTILGCPNAWQNPLGWIQNLLDGLFLSIFTTNYPQWLVLEVGADRPGDISNTAKWLKVDIAVITRLPEVPVHVEFFESSDEVVEEKAALINALKHNGTLVLYADDERAERFSKRAQGKKIITFGFSDKAEVRAEDLQPLFEQGKAHWPIGMSARIVVGGVSAPVEVVGTLGAHTLLPALAAAAVGAALGKSVAEVVDALKGYEPPVGRMHLIEGIKDTLIIDDTYNSSPAAVIAALDTLQFALPKGGFAGRRIAVLGDMLELGRHSAEEHKKMGTYAAAVVDLLVTVGLRARGIAQGALDAGLDESKILQFEDADKAGEELAALVAAGDCVVVKGSQSMRMERVVEELMVHPERAKDLLVRQDPEWRKR